MYLCLALCAMLLSILVLIEFCLSSVIIIVLHLIALLLDLCLSDSCYIALQLVYPASHCHHWCLLSVHVILSSVLVVTVHIQLSMTTA